MKMNCRTEKYKYRLVVAVNAPFSRDRKQGRKWIRNIDPHVYQVVTAMDITLKTFIERRIIIIAIRHVGIEKKKNINQWKKNSWRTWHIEYRDGSVLANRSKYKISTLQNCRIKKISRMSRSLPQRKFKWNYTASPSE